MKHLKFDPMTVLIVVVAIGVVVTMSTQASTQAFTQSSDRSVSVSAVQQATIQPARKTQSARR